MSTPAGLVELAGLRHDLEKCTAHEIGSRPARLSGRQVVAPAGLGIVRASAKDAAEEGPLGLIGGIEGARLDLQLVDDRLDQRMPGHVAHAAELDRLRQGVDLHGPEPSPDPVRPLEDRDPPIRPSLNQPVREVCPGRARPDDRDVELVVRRRAVGRRVMPRAQGVTRAHGSPSYATVTLQVASKQAGRHAGMTGVNMIDSPLTT